MCKLQSTRREIWLAILVPVVLLIAAEILLRLAAVFPMPPRRESVIDYQSVRQPLVRSFEYYGDHWKELDQALRKPPVGGSSRIFCFGGSAAQGWEIPDQAFPQQLGRIFARTGHPEIEVYNFGAIGWSSSQIVTAVQETIKHYHPSLIVLYAGHNELHELEALKLTLPPKKFEQRMRLIRTRMWLERLRLVLLVEGAAMHLRGPVERKSIDSDNEIRLDKWPQHTARMRDLAMGMYDANVTHIAQICRAHRVNLLLCTVAVNLRIAYFNEDLPQELSDIFNTATQQFKIEKLDEVLKTLESAGAIRDVTEIHFLRARTLEKKREIEEARREYIKASDLSALPIRAFSQVNQILRDTARRFDLPLLDVENIVASRSENGICCHHLVDDHVHFTPEGHRLVAGELHSFIREKVPIESLKDEWVNTKK